MRRSTVLFLVILAAIVTVIVLMGADLNAGMRAASIYPAVSYAQVDPSPSASPSPAATPTPAASAATVRAALAQKHRAERAHGALSRVRDCFGAHPPVRVAAAPKRAACEAAWAKAGKRWKGQARDWQAKVTAGVAKMRRPGGSGAARWIPAMRFTGWSEYGIAVMVPISQRESSGSPHVPNHEGSGCYGLYQLHPCWWGDKGLAWIRDPFNQCRLAWRIFHVIQHDSPHPAWSL